MGIFILNVVIDGTGVQLYEQYIGINFSTSWMITPILPDVNIFHKSSII